jgi:hypothetical protein
VVLVLVAGASLASCAGYTASIRRDDRASADSAYLYGRFFIESKSVPLGLAGYQTMGLVLSCAGGATYTIRFANTKGVQVIKARPARCALTQVVYTDADGAVRRRSLPPRGWGRPQDFVAGYAYYLGDYTAVASFDSEWKVLYTQLHWGWDMEADADNYEETTEEMKRSFAGLAALPTENRRLAPPARLPARNGRPGEVAPSPQRVAGLAPFIKRTFTTPAECDAACPTGQCLPFRSEGGAAMTCVVRCKADKDCPAGLACNCPESEGQDCRLIARTASDPMDGFCLSVEPGGPRR